VSLATLTDVTDRLGRPGTPDEQVMLTNFLEDAEAEILRRAPNALTRAGTDTAFARRLVSVECSAALRASRLPVGVDLIPPDVGVTDFNPATQVGYIQILRREWRSLGVANAEIVTLTPGIKEAYENSRYYRRYEGYEDGWGWREGWLP
jgi:hypothetical protein